MKAAIVFLIGLVFEVSVSAESLLEGRVRLPSGAPVPGAQVLLFDLTDLRAAPLAATTDWSGHFTLPLATLSGTALPERFELGANYPNPFNPSTMIPYQLPAAMQVRLEVFNILGQRVATLVDGERPAGFHTASWDATDAAGQAVGAGVYLYRLSGDGVQTTRSMLLIDGQAGIPSGGSGSTVLEGGAGEDGEASPVYGLTVSGPGLVPYVDPAFRVEAGMAPLEVVVEAPGGVPSAKVASNGILGDVDNTGGVDVFDALLVALYSLDASVVMPNNGDIGDISLGDVNADGQIDLADAYLIAAYLKDPSDPSLPAGIGQPVGAPLASLSPDPSTVAFADDGAWYRFTVEAGEPVSVVANPGAATPRLEITARSGRGNYCPGEADDDRSRQDGQTLYLSGCATGPATVELRRESDGVVLRTYIFEVTGSPADTASLSPDPSTVAFADDGAWHRFTVEAGEPVSVVANPGAVTPRLEITARSGRGNYCPAVADDDVARQDGQTLYLSGCATGPATLELRRESDGAILRTYIFEVTGSPADLVVESVSVSDNSLTPGKSFTLSATVRNQGTGQSAATTLQYYRSSNRTISTRDTEVGTDEVGPLSAAGTTAESISLTARSSEGTYYYGACVVSVSGESTGNNCFTAGVRVTVEAASWDSVEAASPDSVVGFGQRQQPDARAILHLERHRPQPGQGCGVRDYAALLPVDGQIDHDIRHKGGHGRGAGAWRSGEQQPVSGSDRG